MKTIVSLLMKLVAVVVFVQLVAVQIYDPKLSELGLTIWEILDPIMALGLIVVIIDSYKEKVATASGGVTQIGQFICSRFRFYAAWFVMALLLWNWAGHLFAEATELPLVWLLVDAAIPPLLFSTGTVMARRE